MYHDLNFNADDLEPFAAREKSASAETLEYSIVATNHTAVERLTLKDRSAYHMRYKGTALYTLITALGPLGPPDPGGRERNFVVGQLQRMVQVVRLATSSDTCISSTQGAALKGTISLASADPAQQANLRI